MSKSILITGCSTGGIGHALAKAFHARGLVVFATARTPSKMADLEKISGIHLLRLDVTDAVSIAEAVEAVSAKTGGKLDYLINNSGRGNTMPALDYDVEEEKKVFDVNFWGVLRMVQGFAGLLVEARGTIVTIGSGLGLVHMPYTAIYNSSKAAVHMLDETLRVELAPLGVGVLTVVTGKVASSFLDNNPPIELPHGSRYQELKDTINAMAQGDNGIVKTDLGDYVKNVVEDILGGATGKTYRGSQASVARYASIAMPMWLMDRILIKGSGLETWKPKPKSS